MNRTQFMDELEKLLSEIPEEERNEVLDFYEGYFDDAGEENESEVIRKLGSPEKLALSIKYNLRESNDDYAEYTERGYEDIRTREEGEMPDQYTVVGHSRVHKSGNTGHSDNEEYKENSERTGRTRRNGSSKLILCIILMVFMAPFLKGLIGGLLVGVVVAIAVAFGLPVIGIIAAAAITFALGVAAIVIVATAIPLLFTNIAVGILLIGLGMFFLAAVCIGAMIVRWIAITVLPRYLRRFTETCRRFAGTGSRFIKRFSKGGTGT